MEASNKAQVTMDIVHVEGRTIEGVKVMGLLPESAYANGDDFNIYVRWDVTHGTVRATRSDTDAQIITIGLTRQKAKGAAFAELMQALANHYGMPVVVQADPGIKGAHAHKLVGTWAPEVIEAPFNPTDPSTWGLHNLPAGWAWVESAECDGEFRLFTPEGTDHTQAISDLRQAQAAQRLADATATLTGLVGQVLSFDNGAERIVTRVEANTVWLVTVGQDQAKQYPLVGLYEHLTQGRITALDASDIAEAQAQAWCEAGSPRDAAGRPDVSALPIRTPGAAWELIEAEIWAGTDLVEPMRRTRLSRKGKRALERAFREGCCGRADHERWCRTWRPITKRHARLMGIDRKDAVLLRPRFADLLAVRVGK